MENKNEKAHFCKDCGIAAENLYCTLSGFLCSKCYSKFKVAVDDDYMNHLRDFAENQY